MSLSRHEVEIPQSRIFVSKSLNYLHAIAPGLTLDCLPLVGQTFENLDVPRFPIPERNAEVEESENHSKISGAKNICHLIISPRLFPLASRLLLIRELLSFSKAAFSTQFRKGKMDAIFSLSGRKTKKQRLNIDRLEKKC